MGARNGVSADLAAQIRAAVAETATPAPRWDASGPSAGEEEGGRLPLRRAAAYVTPSVPPGARLSGLKRFALRVLRFLWRDQAAFNALTLESANAILTGLASQRRVVEQLRVEHAAFREEQAGWRKDFEGWNTAWERRAAIEDGRLAALEITAQTPRGDAVQAVSTPAASIPPGVYSLFEERFRGKPEEIAEKQRAYLPLFDDLPGPALDAGCGRGELLRLLAERGIQATGVEINPIAADEARQSGVAVEDGDALEALSRRAAGSLGAVVALQVVEHWSAARTFAFLCQARRALAPGGLLLLETINVDSLSAWKAFYLDPTHVRPVPPEALRFLVQAAGFAETRIDLRAPLPAAERLEERSENDAKLNRLLFGPQDYALIARVPRVDGH
jgi:SAM-dependent methyltransferase